ncbi:major outer membrane protein [Campylobacter sp. RKI_CA19_01128]|uniref:major outer membrane protein n=1 Tax=unclassified Campylobacter TaxID=2593542 RepID=UPI0021E64B57|nr:MULTISPECIES: major outer membrane protein [unclassified Campylobacter]MCV3348520.1 major outer membrane protein [Campylobacter sp. RKI_CA19_01127]MCV3354576.1 major outer membrane protein [Campylobacter sp. RKI_CA19_01128]MCV3471219.1 major outer membrane protein [Campylobacter sp. CNRCH_2015_0814]HEC1776178.1 major outer membrane protein [Campylobacter lari]
MKLVKLSLVAALAAGAFSAANAVSLEEAIKDVDVSGMMRYRFQSDRQEQGDVITDGYNSSKNNEHKFKAQLNFKAALDDNFKAFVQFQYDATDVGFGNKNGAQGTTTSDTFNVNQAYLEYTNEAYATNVIFGKMEVGSIWTDDAVGTGAKVLNNSIEGLTFAGYWFDAFNWEDDSDFTDTKLKKSSLYGAAVLGDFDPFAFQLWAAYSANNAFLYAVDASYKFAFNDMNFKIQGQYLGNSLDSDFEKFYGNNVDNGNFYAAKFSGNISAFDFQAGVVGYGDKDKQTVVTLEDTGRVIAPGQQIFYAKGTSQLTHVYGENFFYFAGLGYTFAETLRVGFDYIGGKTEQTGKNDIDKNEYVGSISYAYSPKLTFSGFYSYLTEDFNTAGTSDKDDQFIRLEALYKF